MRCWTAVAASCQGVSHKTTETRRQDNFTLFFVGERKQYLCTIVSDGAGSASHGGQGASLVCRFMGSHIRHHLTSTETLPTDELIESWFDDVRDRIASAATSRSLANRDFAATAICVISDGEATVLAHVGDGCVVGRDIADAAWHPLSWPDQGEYAATTFFVTDDRAIRLRITRPNRQIDAVAAFTDGIERLALDFSDDTAHQPFFAGIIRPVEDSEISGIDMPLSQKLKAFLDSDRINERTDDDKTLVLAALK